MRLLILLFFTSYCYTGLAQVKQNIRVTGGENKNPVAATISIRGVEERFTANDSGFASITFPASGTYILIISAVDHSEKHLVIGIPFGPDTLEITLERNEEEMEEVIIQSTRTSRTIANVPTRIETIDLEEIDEKTMRWMELSELMS